MAESKAMPKMPRPCDCDCGCGCGDMTKGGRFRPGHDARLLSRQLADQRAADARPAATSTPAPTRAPRPCACGCGDMTKGVRFRPGHDARLLRRQIANPRARILTIRPAGAPPVVTRAWFDQTRTVGTPTIGIDPTAGGRPAGLAVLDGAGTLVELRRLPMDSVLAACNAYPGAAVGIDCPLSMPRGLHCFDPLHDCPDVSRGSRKRAEEAVAAMGISLYWTTKRSIIAAMIVRCIELRHALEVAGHRVFEVYPYAAKVLLFGAPVPRKTEREGLAWFREQMGALCGADQGVLAATHDELDAALVALVVRGYRLGKGREVGDADEGTILLPPGGERMGAGVSPPAPMRGG